MNLYRKLIPGNVFVSIAISGNFEYVAAVSNPDAGLYELVAPAVEGWDLYGNRSQLDNSDIRAELAALYVDWASSSASEKDVFARWFVADVSDRDTLYTTEEQEAFAETLCIKIMNDSTEEQMDAESNRMATGEPSETDRVEINIKNQGAWKPNSIPLGSVLTSGASFFVNGGAGVYLSFAGNADDTMYFNDSLEKFGFFYDGSNLALKIHCRLSSDGGVGDTIGLVLDYAIVKDGDNSSTTVTNVPQQNIDVSGELQDIDFNVTLATMIGVSGADMVMVTLTRNGAGANQDTFAGNFEILGLEWIKV